MEHGGEQYDHPLACVDGMEQGRSPAAAQPTIISRGGASASSALSTRSSAGNGHSGETYTASIRGPRPVSGPLPGVDSVTSSPPSTLQAFASEVQAVLDAARPEDSHDTPASSAERHRLANSIGINLPSVAQWIEKSAPLFALLAIFFVATHARGIAGFVVYSIGLQRLHSVIHRQVALKGERHKRACLATAALALVGMLSLMWVFSRQQLWMSLVLANLLPLGTVWDVIFTVAMADMLVRQYASALKLVAIACHDATSRTQLRHRSQMLAFIDHTAMFWRTLLGTPCWYAYLSDGGRGQGLWGPSCAGIFIMLKMSATYDYGAVMVASGIALRRGPLGMKAPTAAELSQAGNQCSICHDDIRAPIRLSCSHVFCEECICEWLEREGTCPYCRTIVQSPCMINSEGLALLPTIF